MIKGTTGDDLITIQRYNCIVHTVPKVSAENKWKLVEAVLQAASDIQMLLGRFSTNHVALV